MSAFIAITNTNGAPIDRGILLKLTESLHFRGPDRQKLWVDGSIGLGHALFRTTDEAQFENQPASLDGKVWITGCIRIDARKELIDKLEITHDIRIKKTPDSLLVLHAYQRWGEECLSNLLGDFAFVIWDSKQRKLFCARDRFGMRQLYHAQIGNIILISNSLHCLLLHPQISRKLNDQSMGDFLLFGDHTWLDKTCTAFADVSVLPPAHQLTLINSRLSTKRYWNIPTDLPLLRYHRENEYIEHFQEIFEAAITDRIRTPEVVISMSGGMDSSTIAATLCKLQKKNAIAPLKVNTITAVYDLILPDEERYYTNLVASHLKLPTCFIAGDAYPLLDPAIATTRPLELVTPKYWLDFRREISARGKVVLTGASADNLLECSPILATLQEANPALLLLDMLRMRLLYGRFPPLKTGLIAKLKGIKQVKNNNLISTYPYPTFFNREFEHRVGLQERWLEWLAWKPTNLNLRHPSAHNSLTGADWNTDDLCMEPDFTLAEERDPFLDLRLVEFIFSIPSVPWLFHKHILRRAMALELPKETTQRPKTPLGDLYQSLLIQPKNAWVNHWNPVPELSAYIDETRIPKIQIEQWNGNAAYVNLRPLLLDRWMREVL